MRYLVPLILVISSCSSSWHLKKAIQKDPSILVSDTITVIDTVRTITQLIEHDTAFVLSETHDTVIIKEDKLTVKHYYDRTTDSVFIIGKCDADTIIQYREIEVPYEKVIVKKDYSRYIWILAVVLFLILVLIQIKSRNGRNR